MKKFLSFELSASSRTVLILGDSHGWARLVELILAMIQGEDRVLELRPPMSSGLKLSSLSLCTNYALIPEIEFRALTPSQVHEYKQRMASNELDGEDPLCDDKDPAIAGDYADLPHILVFEVDSLDGRLRVVFDEGGSNALLQFAEAMAAPPPGDEHLMVPDWGGSELSTVSTGDRHSLVPHVIMESLPDLGSTQPEESGDEEGRTLMQSQSSCYSIVRRLYGQLCITVTNILQRYRH